MIVRSRKFWANPALALFGPPVHTAGIPEVALRAFPGGSVLLAGVLLLSGCNAPPAPAPAERLTHASSLAPADPRLAEIYAHSCKACHAQALAGAPLAGDVDAWKPRIAKGTNALVTSVLTGIRGMPAGGQCFSCTPDDYRALIAFMSTGSAQ
jgi:cytochrome c5